MTGVMMSLLLSAPHAPRDGAMLKRDLDALLVVGNALYVAAHPDDENTRLLASLANEAKFRTAYLSLTRGEGGQNLIGPELGPLLGVIRTHELLAARRIDGAEQFFTRARDFGYSKSVDETLAVWDHEAVLADAVFVIRTFRPDVVITRFSLEAGGTHGHHTASARLAVEAFGKASDASFHPEWPTWKPKRVVWNAWSPDRGVKVPDDAVPYDTSQYSPLLGLSYGELAATSRSMHKSQGFGAAALHEGNVERFVHLAGDKAQGSLFDGIDSSWKRVAGAEKVAELLTKAKAEFRVEQPAASVPVLAQALEALRALPDNPWKAPKLEALTRLMADCAGLFVEVTGERASVVPLEKTKLTVTALNRSAVPLTLERVRLLDGALTTPRPLEKGAPVKVELEVTVPSELTTPYWLEAPPTPGIWSIAAHHPIGAPERSSPFTAELVFKVGATTLTLQREASFKWVDPTVGERHRPLEIIPSVVVAPKAQVLAFADSAAKPLVVTVTANADGQRGAVTPSAPEGFVVEPSSRPYSLDTRGQTTDLAFTVRPAPKSAVTQGVLAFAAGEWSRSLTRVDYPHVPPQIVLAPAEVSVLKLDVKRGKTKRVGFIPGAGDEVAGSLAQIGYEVTTLGDDALMTQPLGRFDAIVVGIRAYNVNPKLPAASERLMQYVKDGGTLVVQYNTRNWLSTVPAKLGPFPFEVSQDRVTDETAPVTRAAHAVFAKPNVITDADFSGWVQERGLYFGAKWDAAYETPLSMNDPGEKPTAGALLIATHGKGRFIYTGLSFFRQLPAGVPGAYRLFANLLDHGR